MRMFCPLVIGISEIICPELVSRGIDNGSTSSRPASRANVGTMGCKRRDSCAKYKSSKDQNLGACAHFDRSVGEGQGIQVGNGKFVRTRGRPGFKGGDFFSYSCLVIRMIC